MLSPSIGEFYFQQDPGFSDSIRHVMDGSLPNSLKHVISNAEYYGPSLFLLATDVVTAYVFQEPSLLSSLQVHTRLILVQRCGRIKNPAFKDSFLQFIRQNANHFGKVVNVY